MKGRFTRLNLLIRAKLSYAYVGRHRQFTSRTSTELFGYQYCKIYSKLYLALSLSLIQINHYQHFLGRVTHSQAMVDGS